MLSEENNEWTFKDKLIQWLFTVEEKETGNRRIRNSEFAKNMIANHFQRKFEEQRKKAYKFKLNTIIKYPKKFAEKYKFENRPFVINLNKGQIIDLQIIHPCLIENPARKNTDKFGYTIHLPFDITDKDAAHELELFKKQDYYSKFKNNSNEGIEDYILDCGEDYDLLDKIMQRILIDLKDYNEKDEIIIEHFFA